MSSYNWELIFKDKSQKELIEIFKGNSHLNTEAEIYAGLELRNRNYDFNEIREFHNRKIEDLKREITDFQNLDFKKSEYFRQQIGAFFGIAILVFILISSDLNSESQFHFYKALIYLCILVFTILTAKWNFNRFKKNKEKNIQSKIEALNKLK